MKINFLRLTKKRMGNGNDFDLLAQSFHYRLSFYILADTTWNLPI